MRLLVAFLLILSGSLSAATIDGKWKSAVTGGGGHEKTFVEVVELKADGGKLTGTFSRGMNDSNPLEDGTIDGSKVKFYVTMPAMNGERRRCKFEGTLKADTLDLDMTIQGGPTWQRVFQKSK
ncbi:MAG: hypothetical protein ABI823_20670 [Bryobacteraceae bacterium]